MFGLKTTMPCLSSVVFNRPGLLGGMVCYLCVYLLY